MWCSIQFHAYFSPLMVCVVALLLSLFCTIIILFLRWGRGGRGGNTPIRLCTPQFRCYFIIIVIIFTIYIFCTVEFSFFSFVFFLGGCGGTGGRNTVSIEEEEKFHITFQITYVERDCDILTKERTQGNMKMFTIPRHEQRR